MNPTYDESSLRVRFILYEEPTDDFRQRQIQEAVLGDRRVSAVNQLTELRSQYLTLVWSRQVASPGIVMYSARVTILVRF